MTPFLSKDFTFQFREREVEGIHLKKWMPFFMSQNRVICTKTACTTILLPVYLYKQRNIESFREWQPFKSFWF